MWNKIKLKYKAEGAVLSEAMDHWHAKRKRPGKPSLLYRKLICPKAFFPATLNRGGRSIRIDHNTVMGYTRTRLIFIKKYDIIDCLYGSLSK